MRLSLGEACTPASDLRQSINNDPSPLAPSLAPLKAILAKADPPAPRPEPPPLLPPADATLCQGNIGDGGDVRTLRRLGAKSLDPKAYAA